MSPRASPSTCSRMPTYSSLKPSLGKTYLGVHTQHCAPRTLWVAYTGPVRIRCWSCTPVAVKMLPGDCTTSSSECSSAHPPVLTLILRSCLLTSFRSSGAMPSSVVSGQSCGPTKREPVQWAPLLHVMVPSLKLRGPVSTNPAELASWPRLASFRRPWMSLMEALCVIWMMRQ